VDQLFLQLNQNVTIDCYWIYRICSSNCILDNLITTTTNQLTICNTVILNWPKRSCRGRSLSEVLILASNNPQYDDRLFIELPVQYMKIPSSEHVVFINCSECQNKTKKIVFTMCSELSMNILLSYCGLVDARINASENDLPVIGIM
jgi:hypothetical protein